MGSLERERVAETGVPLVDFRDFGLGCSVRGDAVLRGGVHIHFLLHPL